MVFTERGKRIALVRSFTQHVKAAAGVRDSICSL